jgi:hypothetical protein
MTNVMDIPAPAPAPETVAAARRHLTERYAAGVDRLLWETGQRPMPDLAAITDVLAADGQAGPVDIGCALVLVQAIRLGLDHLEHDLFEAASGAGVTTKAVAAVLDLTDAAAAEARHRWLAKRRALPPVIAG